MPNMDQIRVVLSGFTGAPGYCQMYFDSSGDTPGAQAHSNAARAFWDAVAVATPTSFRFTIDADVQVIDDSTGDLVSITPTTPLAQSQFGDAAAYAGGAGACVGWVTNAVHGEHRLRGRTFVVPLNTGAYEADGTITALQLGRIRAAATALVATGEFGVWGRPIDGANGLWSQALATNTRDKVAMLRSRRD